MTAVIAIAAQRTTSFLSRKLIVEITGSVVAATIVALISGHLASETVPARDAVAARPSPAQPYVPIIDPLTGKIADRLPGASGAPQEQTATLTVRRPLSSALLFAAPYREASTVWSTPAPAPALAPPLDITAGIRMAGAVAPIPTGPQHLAKAPQHEQASVRLPPRDVPDGQPRVAATAAGEPVRLADAAPAEPGWLGRMMPGGIAHAGDALWHNGQSMIGHATSLGGGLVRHMVP